MFGRTLFAVIGMLVAVQLHLAAQHSVARMWNEATLVGIRNDYARPTVHARNLFHVAVAMYDAWAAYDNTAETYLLGKTVHDFSVPFAGVTTPVDVRAAREEAISYAAYRVLQQRFKDSPDRADSYRYFDSLFVSLGYDTSNISVGYANGSPASLGNYIALAVMGYGLKDGANEQWEYANLFYQPVNPPLSPNYPGNPDIIDPNRWQPLAFNTFIDQSGNVIIGAVPQFLSPEWGQVTPFSLSVADRTTFMREGYLYEVYHDPGPPPTLDTLTAGGLSDEYKWGFSLVAIWSAHLDASDTTVWDISPGSLGNLSSFPLTVQDYRSFYDLLEGGDPGAGHVLNPITQQPYAPQYVRRGDYARVLAEFWADGPDSETPPGHWFVILNYVSDHPAFEKRFKGSGPVLDDLEWDVKAYFTLGGTMHDVAISSWGIKGRYDYVRPVSAIRYMVEKGQSSDAGLPSYHPLGIPLVPGYVELVQSGDSLAGNTGQHIGKIKLRAWRGPRSVQDPKTDVGGVGWILGENWWPYQRPTFVTPPFAGYVSGHSTYSRAAAEVMTLLTGDAYFPGGMGEFSCPKNAFLVFEEGPSEDVTLQWATYKDASDQCSLSRIWGGIHPPADDIPGRKIGEVIGHEAFAYAERYFTGIATQVETVGEHSRTRAYFAYPNPVRSGLPVTVSAGEGADEATITLYTILGQAVKQVWMHTVTPSATLSFDTQGLAAGVYFLRVSSHRKEHLQKIIITR